MTKHLYSLRYLRNGSALREYRATVIASSPDEARAFLALKDPEFHSTVETPKRRGVVEPEQADGMTQAKARAFR